MFEFNIFEISSIFYKLWKDRKTTGDNYCAYTMVYSKQIVLLLSIDLTNSLQELLALCGEDEGI